MNIKFSLVILYEIIGKKERKKDRRKKKRKKMRKLMRALARFPWQHYAWSKV